MNSKPALSMVVLMCSLATLLAGGCDKPSPSDPASMARIQLTAGASRLPADGVSKTTIVAYVRQSDGKNADKVPIVWTTTCGLFSESTGAVTGGTASATLVSETYPCSATVSVSIPMLTLQDSITIEFYDEETASIVVQASPSSIPADGDSISVITALVTDQYGHPVPEDSTVYFSTDAGTLSADSATTKQGRTEVTLKSLTVEATAHVTANCGSQTGSCSVRFYSTLVGSIDLRASSYDIPADGNSKSVITATVRDVNGRAVKDGTSVIFTTTSGSLSTSDASTTQGIATVVLTSATHEDTAAVSATSGTITRIIYIDFFTTDLTVDPAFAVITTHGTLLLHADGGSSPYTWYQIESGDYGSIAPQTGPNVIFTAKDKTGVVHVKVVDTQGEQATSTITIAAN